MLSLPVFLLEVGAQRPTRETDAFNGAPIGAPLKGPPESDFGAFGALFGSVFGAPGASFPSFFDAFQGRCAAIASLKS